MAKKPRDLDDMMGTGLGDPVPVKGYGDIDPNLGDPIPAADANAVDAWLSGGKHRVNTKKRKASLRKPARKGRR